MYGPIQFSQRRDGRSREAVETGGSTVIKIFFITRFLADAIMVTFFLLNHVLKVLELSGLPRVRKWSGKKKYFFKVREKSKNFILSQEK